MNRKSGQPLLPSPRRAGREKSGFLFSLEAMSSLMLLVVASSFLISFRLPQNHAGEFFLCSDAAGVLLKSHAFGGPALQENVLELERLSSLCIEAESPGASAASSCTASPKDRYSFTFPVASVGGIGNATVSCWLPPDS